MNMMMMIDRERGKREKKLARNHPSCSVTVSNEYENPITTNTPSRLDFGKNFRIYLLTLGGKDCEPPICTFSVSPIPKIEDYSNMSGLVRLVARLCCDSDDDETEDYVRRQRGAVVVESPASIIVESSSMLRPEAHHVYQPIVTSRSRDEEVELNEGGLPPQDDHDDDEDEHENCDDCCCGGDGPSSPYRNDHGLHEFFRKIRERWRRYDSMETFRPSSTDSSPKEKYKAGLSPLRTASTYDASRDIPTICLDEVVMPGSDLQKQMARAVSLNLEAQGDECVICMEGFDPSNPRMPTLCGCGQNKTYFHLPCLYQWIEQSKDCPSCRETLRWEEF
eukprot:scaffold4425_cov168-Amphora_coffeaeformis.AAC.2